MDRNEILRLMGSDMILHTHRGRSFSDELAILLNIDPGSLAERSNHNVSGFQAVRSLHLEAPAIKFDCNRFRIEQESHSLTARSSVEKMVEAISADAKSPQIQSQPAEPGKNGKPISKGVERTV